MRASGSQPPRCNSSNLVPRMRISSAGLPAAATRPIGTGLLMPVDDEDVAHPLAAVDEPGRDVAPLGVDVIDIRAGRLGDVRVGGDDGGDDGCVGHADTLAHLVASRQANVQPARARIRSRHCRDVGTSRRERDVRDREPERRGHTTRPSASEATPNRQQEGHHGSDDQTVGVLRRAGTIGRAAGSFPSPGANHPIVRS